MPKDFNDSNSPTVALATVSAKCRILSPIADAVLPNDFNIVSVGSIPNDFRRMNAVVISSTEYGVSVANCLIMSKDFAASSAEPVTVVNDACSFSKLTIVPTICLAVSIPRYAPMNPPSLPNCAPIAETFVSVFLLKPCNCFSADDSPDLSDAISASILINRVSIVVVAISPGITPSAH